LLSRLSGARPWFQEGRISPCREGGYLALDNPSHRLALTTGKSTAAMSPWFDPLESSSKWLACHKVGGKMQT
jgi:hypothetical protein